MLARLRAVVLEKAKDGDTGRVRVLLDADADGGEGEAGADIEGDGLAGGRALDDLAAALARGLAHQGQHVVDGRAGAAVLAFRLVEHHGAGVMAQGLPQARFGGPALHHQADVAQAAADDIVHDPGFAAAGGRGDPDMGPPAQGAADGRDHAPAGQQGSVYRPLPHQQIAQLVQAMGLPGAQRVLDAAAQRRRGLVDEAGLDAGDVQFQAVDDQAVAEVQCHASIVPPGAAATHALGPEYAGPETGLDQGIGGPVDRLAGEALVGSILTLPVVQGRKLKQRALVAQRAARGFDHLPSPGAQKIEQPLVVAEWFEIALRRKGAVIAMVVGAGQRWLGVPGLGGRLWARWHSRLPHARLNEGAGPLRRPAVLEGVGQVPAIGDAVRWVHHPDPGGDTVQHLGDARFEDAVAVGAALGWSSPTDLVHRYN